MGQQAPRQKRRFASVRPSPSCDIQTTQTLHTHASINNPRTHLDLGLEPAEARDALAQVRVGARGEHGAAAAGPEGEAVVGHHVVQDVVYLLFLCVCVVGGRDLIVCSGIYIYLCVYIYIYIGRRPTRTSAPLYLYKKQQQHAHAPARLRSPDPRPRRTMQRGSPRRCLRSCASGAAASGLV